jgi:tight adherence protein B
MESLLLPILVAGVVALLAYTAAQIFAPSQDRKKLNERLSGQSRDAATPRGSSSSSSLQQQRSIVQAQATGMDASLIRFAVFRSMHKTLLQSYPDLKLVRLLQMMAGAAAGVSVLIFLLSGSLLVAGVAALLACWTPVAVVTAKRNRRQRLLAGQLPEALDFLGRILKAGHSFSTGLQMMGTELPEPLAAEFRRGYDQHSLGISIEEALKEMATRIDSSDFAFFVTATLIQRQTGGDLSEVLGNISGMIRQRSRLQQQVKAKTAEGRFTGYILSAFPGVMFVIVYTMNPEYASVLVNTTEGMVLLGVAFGLQVLGLFAIKKITTVSV